MRIAMMAWESLYAVPVGGVAVYVSKLSAALRDAGHQVHVFTRMGPEQRLFDNVFGVLYHRCPFEPQESFVKSMRAMCDSFVHYAGVAQEKYGPFDQVHCNDWMTIPAGLRLKAECGCPMAVTFHTTEYGRTGVWPESPEAKALSGLELQGIDVADAVIPVSVAVRQQIDMLYHCPDWKQQVIYHGMDCIPFDAEGFDAGLTKEAVGVGPMDPMVLFVGRLNHRKGPDRLLAAIPRVLEERPQAVFVLVGEGGLKEHLAREAERLGIAHAVRLVGARSGQALTNLYRAADLVASPSRSDPFGVVALSAWAGQTPILATAVGAPAEFVKDEDNGWLLPEEEVEEKLAPKILEAFEDFDRLRWMGRNGRVAVETAFTWATVAGQVAGAYSR